MQLLMPPIAGLALSFAFLGIAYLAGYLSHSSTVFVAVIAIGLVVRLAVRRAS
jgi:hypothetical protein